MKIILDTNKCISCGACWALCPKFFEQGKDSKSSLQEGLSQNGHQEMREVKSAECAKEAAESCPAGAIIIKS